MRITRHPGPVWPIGGRRPSFVWPHSRLAGSRGNTQQCCWVCRIQKKSWRACVDKRGPCASWQATSKALISPDNLRVLLLRFRHQLVLHIEHLVLCLPVMGATLWCHSSVARGMPPYVTFSGCFLGGCHAARSPCASYLRVCVPRFSLRCQPRPDCSASRSACVRSLGSRISSAHSCASRRQQVS